MIVGESLNRFIMKLIMIFIAAMCLGGGLFAQDKDTGCGPVFIPKPQGDKHGQINGFFDVFVTEDGFVKVALPDNVRMPGLALSGAGKTLYFTEVDPLSIEALKAKIGEVAVYVSAKPEKNSAKAIFYGNYKGFVVDGKCDLRLKFQDLVKGELKLGVHKDFNTEAAQSVIWKGDCEDCVCEMTPHDLDNYVNKKPSGFVAAPTNSGDLELTEVIKGLFTNTETNNGIVIFHVEKDRDGKEVCLTTIVIRRCPPAGNKNMGIGSLNDEIRVALNTLRFN